MAILFQNTMMMNRRFLLLALLFLCSNFFSQKASIIENITENNGLISNYIFSITEDNNQFLWLGTDKGLVKYQDGKWISFDTDNGLPGNYVNFVMYDGKDGLYITIGEKGIFHFDTEKNRIDYFFKKFSKKYLTGISKSNIDSNYTILLSFREKKYVLSVFHKNNPLKEIPALLENSPSEKKYRIYTTENLKKKLIGEYDTTPKIQEINQNGLTYSYQYGKGIIEKKEGKIQQIISTQNGLKSNYVNGFFKDYYGDLYFSSLGGGLSVIKKNNPKKYYFLEDFPVREIRSFNQNYYVLANNYLYEISNDEIKNRYFTIEGAMCFFVDGNKVFVGNFDGLHQFRKSGKNLVFEKIHHFTAGISKILKQGNELVIALYGGGIFTLKDGKIEDKTGLNYIFRNNENLFELQNGFAATSYEFGFMNIDQNYNLIKSFGKKDGLLSNYVTTVFQSNDTIYVGSKKGISVIKNNKVVQKFDEHSGISGTMVKAIFTDKKGVLCAVTEKAILKKINNKFEYFGSINMLNNDEDYIDRVFFDKDKNQLCVATKNKFSVIDIAGIATVQKVYTPILEKIFSNGKFLTNRNEFFKLSANNISTNFLFASVDRNYFNSAKLYYKVNDDPWKVFREPRILRFSHLAPGSYNISIKSRNKDGFESISPELIQFKVLQPFYLRWWFILASSLLIIGVSSLYFYNYNKTKFQRKLAEIKLQNEIELERKRISRDLHDNIGAYANSLISKLDFLKIKKPENTEEIDDLKENAESILSLLRQTIWVLNNRETNVENVYDRIKIYTLKALKNTIIKVNFDENIADNKDFEASKAITLFRIMQEVLQNIIKHSEASQIDVFLESKDKIILSIKDNGKGFDTNEKSEGYGISNMKYRATEGGFDLKINSKKGLGTEIIININT